MHMSSWKRNWDLNPRLFPGDSDGKESAYHVGDQGSIAG